MILEIFSNFSDPPQVCSTEAGLRSKQQVQAVTEDWGTWGRAEAQPAHPDKPQLQAMLRSLAQVCCVLCFLTSAIHPGRFAAAHRTAVRLAGTHRILTVVFAYCGPEHREGFHCPDLQPPHVHLLLIAPCPSGSPSLSTHLWLG